MEQDMMASRSFRTIVLGALMAVAAGAAGPAAPPAPPPTLPDFKVKSLAGKDVSSGALAGSGRATSATVTPAGVVMPPYRWLLIYTGPQCHACPNVMAGLQSKATNPVLNDRVVMIVGGLNTSNFKLVTKRFPMLADSSWFLDTNKAAFKQLNLRTDSVVMGMEGSRIMWRLGGAPKNPKTLNSILTSWISPLKTP